MRAIGLLLILANVLYLGWTQFVDVVDDGTTLVVQAPHKEVPKIQLANEMNGNSSGIATASSETPSPATTPVLAVPSPASGDALACISVGPFADLPEASQASAILQKTGFAPRQRVEQGEVFVGHWVSVQNFPKREDADRALEMLSKHGLTDVYILPGSDPPNVLSLGVFSDPRRAQKRADDVRELGLQPQIADRTRSGQVYWIDVDLNEPGQLIDTSIFPSEPGKISRLMLRACPR
jgi:hypothetical protein